MRGRFRILIDDKGATAMNAVAEKVLLVPGAAFGGGFFAGNIRVGEEVFALIVAPKSEGDHDDAPWNKSQKMVGGALSYFDGRANTEAMAEAGSKIASWARGLKIGGFDDWYIPSRDELELIYRNLKPRDRDNYTYRHGENPSSVPPGYPYTEKLPAQTDAEAFHEGGAEAMECAWYWSSTQCEPDSVGAWNQVFSNGNQGYTHKVYAGRVRAVRRLKI
jgi:hypothetical protein